MVDPRVIYDLCQELLKPDSTMDITIGDRGDITSSPTSFWVLDNTPKKPSKKSGVIKKMQQALCPQLDSIYNIPVYVEDSLFVIPVHIKLENGKFILKTYDVDIQYTKEQTDVSIRSVKGFKARDLAWAVIAGMLFMCIVAYLMRKK